MHMADQQRPTEARGPSRLARRKKRGNEDPRMIGQWKIGKTIGEGSSGRVKVARHAKTNQYAAIKIVAKRTLVGSRISLPDAPEHAEKVLLGIEREIVIMKLIDHPNVLNLYDVWETGNELYLIMEYVDGGELFDYLVSRGRLPVEEALHYFQQIISAVSYCHSFNIAHRDLKPENLLLSKSGSGRNIKVADFGMAAYADPMMMLSTSCGSPHYASPEVVEGRAYKGSISDIWSCGIILYALLAGRLPFDDENLRILLEKVKVAKFEMPQDIPAPAQDLLSRMLEKDVIRRITMPQILNHPFFLSTTPSPLLRFDAQTWTLRQLSSAIEKPVESEEEIDADIFDNLRTLWHNVPATEIINGLLNDEETWEKAVYHLLLKYRSRRLESFITDEDDKNEKGYGAKKIEDVSSTGDGTLKTMGLVSGIAEDGADNVISTSTDRHGFTSSQRAGWNGDMMPLQPQLVSPSVSYQTCPAPGPTSPNAPPTSHINQTSHVFTAIPRRDQIMVTSGSTPLNFPTFIIQPPSDSSALPVSDVKRDSPMSDNSPADSVILMHTASLSPSLNPQLPCFDVLNPPDVDQAVQRSFYRIVDRLKSMQTRHVQSSILSSQLVTPDPCPSIFPMSSPEPTLKLEATLKTNGDFEASEPPSAVEELHPDDDRFQDAAEDIETQLHIVKASWLEIVDRSEAHFRPTGSMSPLDRSQNHIMNVPLSLGHTQKNVAPGKNVAVQEFLRTSNKENADMSKVEVWSGGDARKKSSLRKTKDGRKALGNRHVQILLPQDEPDDVMMKRKSKASNRSIETSPAISDGSFFLPEESSPRTSWFGNLFQFKPASYNLLSVYDAHTTKEDCARILVAFGVVVLKSDSTRVLRCRLEEIRDSAGVMMVSKAVRFRVELHAVAHAHSVMGYLSSLTMVQEKGALSSFRLVYNRLRREWNLDTPPARTPISTYGPLLTSPALIPVRSS